MTELQKITEALQQEMKSKLSSVDLINDDITVVAGAVKSLREIIARLRSLVAAYTFSDAAEEIMFFKQVKPVFASQYYYHARAFSLRLACLFRSPAAQKRILEQELDRMRLFLQRNREFYTYCVSNSTSLDAIYFRRIDPATEPVNIDPRFSSSHDRKLSRFVAAELLREFIDKQLNHLNQTSSSQPSSLKWTATKTDLTELIYALKAADAFNNGSIDIKQIAEAFEAVCNVDLGDYYRTFHSIQVRKNNPSAFLTKLRDALQSKLDDLA